MRSIFKTIFLSAVVLSVMGASCGIGVPRARPRVIEDKRTSQESRFDPLRFPGDDAVITSDVPAVNDSAGRGDDVAPALGRAPDKRQADQVFSVQVFATKSSSEAKEFQSSIAPLFNEEVWLDYQEPYYRVCVGKTSGAANGDELLKKVRGKGFRKAWLVKVRQ